MFGSKPPFQPTKQNFNGEKSICSTSAVFVVFVFVVVVVVVVVVVIYSVFQQDYPDNKVSFEE